MPSAVTAVRWEGVDGLQFVGQTYPTHALLDLSPVSVVIHKQKFSTHGAPKQTYKLFQNDIPIDVACHHYTLNMQVSSGSKNNSSPNEPSCTTVMVSFNGVLLVVTGTWDSYTKVWRESDCKLNLDSSENITQDHCCGVHNACSLLQVNRRRK
ncbi:uncharacterized protein TNCV_1346931 [Trichonephila clavipes]|nr:uncharacterized protein TNCV_1346931 [Trichonephila clavipes]